MLALEDDDEDRVLEQSNHLPYKHGRLQKISIYTAMTECQEHTRRLESVNGEDEQLVIHVR